MDIHRRIKTAVFNFTPPKSQVMLLYIQRNDMHTPLQYTSCNTRKRGGRCTRRRCGSRYLHQIRDFWGPTSKATRWWELVLLPCRTSQQQPTYPCGTQAAGNALGRANLRRPQCLFGQCLCTAGLSWPAPPEIECNHLKLALIEWLLYVGSKLASTTHVVFHIYTATYNHGKHDQKHQSKNVCGTCVCN